MRRQISISPKAYSCFICTLLHLGIDCSNSEIEDEAMMYSQQEYDMVRRQTIQIEAEKRALLRWALIVVTGLLALTLLLTAWMYRSYSAADEKVEAALSRAANAETELQQVRRELEEKKAILDRNTAAGAKVSATIETVVPRMLNLTAADAELAQLAYAIYQQPGHMIELPRIPPNSVLRSYRLRVENKPYKFTFVPGLLDNKWVLYSVLVKNQED